MVARNNVGGRIENPSTTQSWPGIGAGAIQRGELVVVHHPEMGHYYVAKHQWMKEFNGACPSIRVVWKAGGWTKPRSSYRYSWWNIELNSSTWDGSSSYYIAQAGGLNATRLSVQMWSSLVVALWPNGMLTACVRKLAKSSSVVTYQYQTCVTTLSLQCCRQWFCHTWKLCPR